MLTTLTYYLPQRRCGDELYLLHWLTTLLMVSILLTCYQSGAAKMR